MSDFGTVRPSLWHSVGNKAMTAVAKLLFGLAISDLLTYLKLLPIPGLGSRTQSSDIKSQLANLLSDDRARISINEETSSTTAQV